MRKDSPYYLPSIKVLQSSALFHGIDEQMMETLLADLTPVTMPKKSLITTSQTKEHLFIIISGRVKLSRISLESGREYIMTLLHDGDTFDLIPFLDGQEHDIVVEAIDELQLLKTPLASASAWMDTYPAFSKNLLRYLGKKMRDLEEYGSDTVLLDTMTRLVKLIVRNIDKDEAVRLGSAYPVSMIDDLSHEVLAQMIGSARKVVNLNIQILKKEGAIDSVRGRLSIKDLNKLLQRYNEN